MATPWSPDPPEPPHRFHESVHDRNTWKMAFQHGWRYGWARGASDEAESRKIQSQKLREITECIAAFDGHWSDERALGFLRAVFFPNPWDRWSFWLLRRFRVVRRITKRGQEKQDQRRGS